MLIDRCKQKIEKVEKQFQELKLKINELEINEQKLHSSFLSLKDQISNIELPFFCFIYKNRFKIIKENQIKLTRFKNQIDFKMKEGYSFKEAILIGAKNELY